MAKVLSCRDMGVDCGWSARADTVEEVMAKAAVHAKEHHGITEITPELEAKAKAAIKDE
jgi:predicted small metal-binding protein